MSVRFFANYLDEASLAFVSMLFDYPRRVANIAFTYGNGPFTFSAGVRVRFQ